MPDEVRPNDTPPTPSPARVAATLLLWAAAVFVGLAVLCFALGALMAPAVYN